MTGPTVWCSKVSGGDTIGSLKRSLVGRHNVSKDSVRWIVGRPEVVSISAIVCMTSSIYDWESQSRLFLFFLILRKTQLKKRGPLSALKNAVKTLFEIKVPLESW